MPWLAGRHRHGTVRGDGMNYREQALSFECAGDALVGIACLPPQPCRRAALIVVGGPQYRAGSHRQFTLLARRMAAQGIASLRFDYRGMGDSEGAVRDFAAIDADLRAGVDQLMAVTPGCTEVVIWGLCDAATAAMFYAAGDSRVCGLVLLNPWARTTDGIARTTLKHYYRQRLFDPAFWKKVASGRFNPATAGKSLARLLRAALGKKAAAAAAPGERAGQALPARMLDGFSRFKGNTLLIISGVDLTAQEFMDMVKASPAWQRQLEDARVSRQDFALADHTFSRRAWRDQVSDWTVAWMQSW